MPPESIQRGFFARMTDPQAFRLMFDQQPNAFFFVKNRESRLIAASMPMDPRLMPLSRASRYLLSPHRSRNSCKRPDGRSRIRSALSWASWLSDNEGIFKTHYLPGICFRVSWSASHLAEIVPHHGLALRIIDDGEG